MTVRWMSCLWSCGYLLKFCIQRWFTHPTLVPALILDIPKVLCEWLLLFYVPEGSSGPQPCDVPESKTLDVLVWRQEHWFWSSLDRIWTLGTPAKERGAEQRWSKPSSLKQAPFPGQGTSFPVFFLREAEAALEFGLSSICDHIFSHPGTNQARPCLASEIRQDREHSGWYGCRLWSYFLCQ